jgi:hypothetical protein
MTTSRFLPGSKTSRWSSYRFTAIGLFALCNSICAADRDHLVAQNFGEIDADWRKLVHQKLFVTPAEFGRVLFLFSGTTDGEYAVAIHSDSKSPTGVTATYTKASENISQATWKDNPKRKTLNAIGVSRVDVPIARTAAESVSQAWAYLIARTRPIHENEVPPSEGVVHGYSEIEISLTNGVTGDRLGLATPFTKGKHVSQLEDIAKLLIEYCHVRGARLIAVTHEIEQACTLLQTG